MKIGLVYDWTASVESMYGLDILGDLSEILVKEWSFEVSKALLLGRYRLETGLSCSSEQKLIGIIWIVLEFIARYADVVINYA